MEIFYTYCYLDPRKPGDFNYGEYHFDYEPIYIGKGCNGRINDHLKPPEICVDYFHNKIRKIINLGLEPIRYKLFENIEESIAFSKEIELIAIIGRSDKGLGPLLNLTDGGDGNFGYIFTPEQRQAISERLSGANHPNFGKPLPEAIRNKISQTEKGKKHSDAARAKMRESWKTRAPMTELTRIKMKARIPWNKGLTKESDPRVATIGNKISQAKKKS